MKLIASVSRSYFNTEKEVTFVLQISSTLVPALLHSIYWLTFVIFKKDKLKAGGVIKSQY
jgi:hypothetical protein